MIEKFRDESPGLCRDYKYRKKLYDLLVYNAYISIVGKSEDERSNGNKFINIAKEMIIECNRKCISSKCLNMDECTRSIEKENFLKLPEGLFSLDKPDIRLGTFRNSALSIIKRVFRVV